MKKLLFTSIFLLAMSVAFSQTKTKKTSTEKAPTQKEIEEMMKEAQQQMDSISPEDKKMMEDMGVKMPDMNSVGKSVSGISDEQLANAAEVENRIVPVKDAGRITIALSTKITASGMPAYIDKTNEYLKTKVSANTKSECEQILAQGKLQNLSMTDVGKTSVFLWLYGKPMHALYLAGIVCKAAPADANNLNNYAGMLAMAGAEQLALPILVNLNKQYPKNSTILNNICQAWFGLGDIDRANKYADTVIRICAFHPQANLTKCLIEESKGNIPAAIEAAKRSIMNAYSPEKENKLKKLGYKLKPEDIDWDKPMPQDAMGLSKFTWPEYPLDVETSKPLEVAWIAYKESCKAEEASLEIKRKRLEKEYKTQSEKRMQDVIQASQEGRMVPLVPESTPKAIVKLRPLVEKDEANSSFVFADEMQILAKAYALVGDKQAKYDEQQKELDKKYEDQIGEGKANPFEAICKDENAIRDEFLSVNTNLEVAFKGYQQTAYRRINNLLYYCQYTQWPEQFELSKVWAQMAWIHMLGDQKVVFMNKSNWCSEKKSKPSTMDSLQEFDDVACQYVSTTDFGFGNKIISQCSRLIAELHVPGIDFDMKKDVDKDRIISGTLVVGVSKSLGATKGPIGAEIEGNLAGKVEFDNSGVTNTTLIAGVNANVAGQTVVGVEGSVSFNGGPSVSGKGLLAK